MTHMVSLDAKFRTDLPPNGTNLGFFKDQFQYKMYWNWFLKDPDLYYSGPIAVQICSQPDPLENCQLNVINLPKTCLFFQKLPKLIIYFPTVYQGSPWFVFLPIDWEVCSYYRYYCLHLKGGSLRGFIWKADKHWTES